MRARLLIAGLAGLSLGAAVAAEPVKAPVRKADHPIEQPAPVIVAAVDEVRTPAATDQPAAAPAKRARKARVTTCRCGDQAAND